MKMKRYVAADMRSALRAIRDEQGPDAVILSTRTTAAGRRGVRGGRSGTGAPGRARWPRPRHSSSSSARRLQELERDDAAAIVTAAASAADAAGNCRCGGRSLARRGWTIRWRPSRRCCRARALPPATRSARSCAVCVRCSSSRSRRWPGMTSRDASRSRRARCRIWPSWAWIGRWRCSSSATCRPASSDEQMQRMPYAMLARRIPICAPPMERSGALALIGPPGSRQDHHAVEARGALRAGAGRGQPADHLDRR